MSARHVDLEFKSRFKSFFSSFSPLQVLDSELPVLEPYFVQKPDLSESGPGLRVTWLGHATVLVEIDGLNVLTDPIFSQRASPVQFMGPKRYRGPPCTVEQVGVPFIRIFDPIQGSVTGFIPAVFCQQLPRIDAVVISHSHYDHLDAGSVSSLNARFGGTLRWCVYAVHLHLALISLTGPLKSHVISV